MLLVDSHCHLDLLKLDKTRRGKVEGLSGVLADARQRGVGHFLCINVDPWQFASLRTLVQPFEDVSLTLGLHPLHEPGQPVTTEQLIEWGRDEQVVGLGETGLDYHYAPDQQAMQRDYFQRHLDAALALGKPVVVHTREARQDTLELLRAFCKRGGQGVIHCFTEDLDFARQIIGMGLYVSFSGIVTFHSADALREVARLVPLDRMLLETDAPYLAPVPHRGQQNEPGHVREVAECIADLRGISVDCLAWQTTENFFRLFPLALRRSAAATTPLA